jgi:anthranilate phosphoribosyltransferase
MTTSDLLEKLHRREDLSMAEAEAAMEDIMNGRMTPSQIGGLLMALRQKGERPQEVVGFARTMRAHAVALDQVPMGVFDTCGTGGDGLGTINVSSMAAVVVAACGVPVAKHGNRSVSSQCGSADLFEGLGVTVAASPSVVSRCLAHVGLAFLFAPVFHPAMKHAGPTRRELGVRSVFNLLGPLTNPAGAVRQLVGVPRPELTELMARALALLGAEHAWVVHGADGLDEVSTTGYTKVSECRAGAVRTFFVHPSEFGVPTATIAELGGAGVANNVAVARAVFDGAPGPAREIVALNAGIALMLAGRVRTAREGIDAATAALDAGEASRVLERLVTTSAAGVVV